MEWKEIISNSDDRSHYKVVFGPLLKIVILRAKKYSHQPTLQGHIRIYYGNLILDHSFLPPGYVRLIFCLHLLVWYRDKILLKMAIHKSLISADDSVNPTAGEGLGWGSSLEGEFGR